MVKLGFAVAGLLSGAIMAFVAFTPGAAVQPAGAVDGLRLFYSGVPILGTLLAMWIMRDYDLDESAPPKCTPSSSGASSRPGRRIVVRARARPCWPSTALAADLSPCASPPAGRQPPQQIRPAFARH
jgi:hypothetical protein